MTAPPARFSRACASPRSLSSRHIFKFHFLPRLPVPPPARPVPRAGLLRETRERQPWPHRGKGDAESFGNRLRGLGAGCGGRSVRGAQRARGCPRGRRPAPRAQVRSRWGVGLPEGEEPPDPREKPQAARAGGPRRGPGGGPGGSGPRTQSLPRTPGTLAQGYRSQPGDLEPARARRPQSGPPEGPGLWAPCPDRREGRQEAPGAWKPRAVLERS